MANAVEINQDGRNEGLLLTSSTGTRLKKYTVNAITISNGQNLGNVGPVYQVRRLSIWILVEFNLSCLFIDGKPVIWIIGFSITRRQQICRTRNKNIKKSDNKKQ